jgi:class 3 adenylate cyclase
MSILFAATYPERTSSLVLYGSYPRIAWAKDYPHGMMPERFQAFVDRIQREWGGGATAQIVAPSVAADAQFRQRSARFERLAASPGAAAAIQRMNYEIDVRHVLSAIRVPTLVLYRSGESWLHVKGSQYLAEHIPGARCVELSGVDYLPWIGDQDALIDEVEEFLTGTRTVPQPDRVLATILFTDIVDSTLRAAELGDRLWRELLECHNALVRQEISQFRGREIETTGDGFHATFDGPGRAIRCACAVSAAVRRLGIQIRAGLHTGEVEMMGDRIGGIAVHIGARVAAQAGAGEVLVSSTVKDLVAGSGLRFEDRGTHLLKGVPGEWRLFAVGLDS